MTRSHKFTDRVYGEAAEEQQQQGSSLPRFFGKNAGFDTDPKKTKKDGGGKGNWGHPGAEVEDVGGLHMNNARRRSNSSSHAKGAKDFKTKFETIEAEPVFEMSEHGPRDEDFIPLEHQSTTSSDDSNHSVAEDK
ncbi:hypothetical protein EJ08DRAFT_639054 [Tothia fuscella]|uniref:Hyaluronan/mRNA-binding protein domain-containing protein n=1 Tax=Tothia fuscella TaxID=1048955 RepID=A0A9P4NK35_9PEZI|nr:hypothetical protein EJ08DRAFT_639054 [Tothia fuscella]